MRLRSPYSCCRVSTDHPRYRGSVRQRDVTTYGGLSAILPAFSVPFNDAGNGVVDTTEYRTNATATITRSTTAWTRGADLNWLEVAAGSIRSYYTASGIYAGALFEGGRQNRCLQSRDLSQAGSWTPTDITPLKDATGIDGVANSASTLTATGASGTILQSIVNASTTRTFSFWVKRKTGTGTINITLDNVTWTAVTVTSAWTLVQKTQTLANPTVGIQIVTSGDAIYVDMCQEETGTFATTPYPAAAAAVTRNTDLLTYPLSVISATEATFYCEITHAPSSLASFQYGYAGSSGAGSGRVAYDGTSTDIKAYDGTTGPTGTCSAKAVDTAVKVATAWGGSTILATGSGNTPTSAAFDGDMSIVTAFQLGGYSGTPAFAALRNAKGFNRKLSASQLQALTV